MPIHLDELIAAANRGKSRIQKLRERADPEGINANLQAIIGAKPKFNDAGILNKKDMREWKHWWEVRGHSTNIEPLGDGLFRCSLKLKKRAWDSQLLRDAGDALAYMQRHGTTKANTKDAFRGWEDFELDEQGLKEAEEAAQWYADRGIKPAKIVSSPLKRALKTAQIIGKKLGVEVVTDDDLKPWNVGMFAGQIKDDTWEEFVYFIDNPTEIVPDGESKQAFAEREIQALQKWLDWAIANGMVIIVAHTSNIVVADCWLKAGDMEMNCRPEEKDIVAPGGICEISREKHISPVFKDVKEEEEEEDPEKAEHEEYDDHEVEA